ncbi:uncharacterized protein LOC141851981 [Brevipalpus obovatus]|uniref:uncharacterized protein LOC141851981 n=1 Tax=Brevipalpus obovatus TaxID=246614 RepID=UPI003D9E7844
MMKKVQSLQILSSCFSLRRTFFHLISLICYSSLVSKNCAQFTSNDAKLRILRSLFSPYPLFSSVNCAIPAACYGNTVNSYNSARPDQLTSASNTGYIYFPANRPLTSAPSTPYYYNQRPVAYHNNPYPYYPPVNYYESNYPYSHSYPPGYIHTENDAYRYPGSSHYGYPMYGQGSTTYSWPSSSLITKLKEKDVEPKYMGRGTVNALNNGITDMSCNFNDPTYRAVSNAAWVKIIGPYNYHEPVPPFECSQQDCSLVYMNGGQNLRYRALTNGPMATLRIYETQPADRGIYRCTITGQSSDGRTHTLYQVVEFAN